MLWKKKDLSCVFFNFYTLKLYLCQVLLQGSARNVSRTESVCPSEILLQCNLLKDFTWFTPSKIAARSWHSYPQPVSVIFVIFHFLSQSLGVWNPHGYNIFTHFFSYNFTLSFMITLFFPFSNFVLFLILFLFHFTKAPIKFWIHEGNYKRTINFF